MALKIGPIAVDPPVVLAPMAGVTNAPFRQICRSYGAALYVSEMVSARALIERNPTTDSDGRGSASTNRCAVFQLYGVDPGVVHAAVRYAVDELGVDHLDLNFGCPAQKVNRVGGGAALPLHHVLFGRIVAAAVRAAGTIPVTVKMRKGIDDDTLTYLTAARSAEDAGAAAISLHARTAEQLYSGAADWSAIAALREAVSPSIPVLGNGDIWAARRCARDDARDRLRRGCRRPRVSRQAVAVSRTHPSVRRAADRSRTVARRRGRGHAPPLGTARRVQTHAATRRPRISQACRVVPHRLRGRAVTTTSIDGRRYRGRARCAVRLARPEARLSAAARDLPRGHLHGPRPVALPAGWRESADDPTPPRGAELAFAGG